MASASKANLEEAFRNVGADVPKGMVHILHHVGSTRQDVYRSMWSSLIYVGKLSTSGKRTLVYPTRVAGADSPGPSSMGSTASSKGFPATGFLSRHFQIVTIDFRFASYGSSGRRWFPADPEACAVIQAEVLLLLQKHAIEEVIDRRSPGFYGRLFVVPKASGGWRPVLDLSPLNGFLRKVPFMMETPASVREALRPLDWVTSIDLTDAYFHILMHRSDRKWLRFLWGDRVFQFRALPFGLSLAPWIFTMIVRQLCALVRQQGIRLRVYLDDWLVLNQLESLCDQHTRIVLQTARDLGFSVNQGKSDLVPSQQFTYLGMVFDTRAWTVCPAQRRIDKLQDLVRSLSSLRHAPVRVLASLQGQMESMSTLIPLGRVHKRPFQAFLNSAWDPASQGWNLSLPLQGWFLESTRQWLDSAWLTQGVPISLPLPELHLFTDASLQGWGAHLEGNTASGLWDQAQKLLHINILELEAVRLGLLEFVASLRGKQVLIHTDNTTVAVYLNKQGARAR
ncbi:uncharacterized protein [Littorina saxatilis]|uniref:uncharacterized protein n=1 Tax=Littorina saxatilis TaxID=31220 RepID=UPI0038B59599